MSFKTLEEQRDELRTRLGFSAAGAAAGVMIPILNSFLQQAQTLLYNSHDWVKLKKYEDKTLGTNAYLLDYPTTANPERVKAISVYYGNIWSEPLEKGIKPSDYTYQDNYTRPWKWEPYSQIELWPKSDQSYTVRIFFIKALARFTQNTDRSDIDDALIAIVALANAKAHYRHPDAANYVQQSNDLLVKLKAQSWGKSVFDAKTYTSCDTDVLPKPVVV